MIWPLRRRDTPPEAPLWNLLDTCAIPFRDPIRAWVDDMHLTASQWSDGLDYCTPIGQTPLFSGMDIPLRAQVSEYTDYDAPPNYLWAAIQGAGDHRLNYAKGIAALTKMFGQGKECSSSNTIAREWRFGQARLTCTVWPPIKQSHGINRRHEVFPETREEAAISIYPAWRPALNTEEATSCRAAVTLWIDPSKNSQLTLSAFTRDWPADASPLPRGIAVTPRGDLVIPHKDRLFDLFPHDRLLGLNLTRVIHGRGGSGSFLKVKYMINTRNGHSTSQKEIATSGDTDGLDQVAADLSSKLDLELDIWTGDVT